MTLLFVDDEPLVIQDIANSLDTQKLGVDKIHLAYSAKQAQEVFQRETIDIILCDIEMPQTNGLELLAWVKERYPATRSIIVTSFSVFKYAQQALHLGCLDYLLKPTAISDLEKAIARAIQTMDGQNRPEPDEYAQLSSTVKRAVLFILDNQSLSLSRQDVASHVFLNPDYLDRRFKSETGMSITQFITNKKVEKAKKLLKDNQHSISEIAELVGYNNLSNFSYMFKQYTGLSPRAYRNSSTGKRFSEDEGEADS